MSTAPAPEHAASLRDSAAEFIVRVMVLAALVWGFWGLVQFGYEAAYRMFFGYAQNLGASPLAQSIQLWIHGVMPYHSLDRPPYSLVPYGPVYLTLSGAVQLLFPKLLFTGGRIVTFAASLGAAGMIIAILRRSGVDRMLAVVPGLLFLSLPYVDRWGVQVNVDMLGVFLELCGLYALGRFACGGVAERRWLWRGIAVCAAAFFTKSSCIAAAGSFGVYLLFKRRFRDAVIFAAVLGAVLAAVYGLMNVLTAGQYYFHTTYEISRRLFFGVFVGRFWMDALAVMPVLCAAALAALVLGAVFRRHGLLWLYLVCSAALTVSLGKQGSDTNYFLGVCAASALGLGVLLGEFRRRGRRALVVLLLAGVLFQLRAEVPLAAHFLKYPEGLKRRAEYLDSLAETIRQAPGPVLAWEMSAILAAGKPIYFEPFPMAQMGYSGVWDQTPILRDLENHKFSLALLYFYAPVLKADRNFTPEFMKAFKANYRYVGHREVPGNKGSFVFYYVPDHKGANMQPDEVQ
ncbi:MAG: hypothetical protein HQL11_04505 [Candidatus Omnitrophica bacterium]|nr:hypothetical protein [Candidatus Omnitrophota bacterium]